MKTLKSNTINYSSMIYDELISILESKYGEKVTTELYLNFGTPALMAAINIVSGKLNCVIYSKYAKSLDNVHEKLLETSHQFMTYEDGGTAVENEKESGVKTRLPSIIYTNDINFLIRPLNNRIYVGINLPSTSWLLSIDRWVAIFPRCRNIKFSINSSESAVINYLNRELSDVVPNIISFLLKMNGDQGRTLIVVPNRMYTQIMSDKLLENGMVFGIIGQEDKYDIEQYGQLCITVPEALSAIVVPYDTIIDMGLTSIDCILGYGLQKKIITCATYDEVKCRTIGSKKNSIIVGKVCKSRKCVEAYDRKTLMLFGYINDFPQEIETYKWAIHDSNLLKKFKISSEYIDLPLSILGLTVLQSWIQIRSTDNTSEDARIFLHEAIVIATIIDNLHEYVLKDPPIDIEDSPFDYLRKLNKYRSKFYGKFRGKTPLETIFNIWSDGISSDNVEKWCKDNNIIYKFFLDIFETINRVALKYGTINEIEMKIPDNTYYILEPLIYAIYNHLTMKWIGEATYESLFSIHQDNKSNTMSVKLSLDPDIVYYNDSDVGLSIPSGKEKPIYISEMPPYLIPLGINKESGIIMSYIPLKNMIPIAYMEYGLPFPM